MNKEELLHRLTSKENFLKRHYGEQAEKMIKEVDKFLQDNFEISLDTYLRLTDSKLKKLLQSEIKNYLKVGVTDELFKITTRLN